MQSSPLQTIREIAAEFGKKVSPCQVFDSNVCSTESTRDRPWEIRAIRGEPFTKCLHLRYGGRKVEILANGDYLNLNVELELPFTNFSLNQEDKRFIKFDFATEVKLGKRLYPVLTVDGSLTHEQETLLSSVDFSNFVSGLAPTEEESLHVTRGGINIYLKSRSVDDIRRIIEAVIVLSAKIEVPTKIPTFEEAPSMFHPLIPLLKTWAVSDDQERADLITEASPSALRELLATVEPFFEIINNYLDSFKDKNLDEFALALMRLAEAAAEAKIRLQNLQTGTAL